jgi:uncharacterized protein DUF6084
VQAASATAGAATGAIPELGFSVEEVRPLAHVAVPTLVFELAIESLRGHAIRSVVLDVQLQIAARRRAYDEEEQTALVELFGAPEGWGTTLATVPWTRATAVVPAFERRTLAELPVVCTYDLEVKASKYLNAVRDGIVPVELLFSGTVFFAGEGGALQTAMIGWDKEADCELPVAAWRQAIEHHFPGAAWLRLGRESFDRLTAYRSRHQLGSFDEAVDSLLGREGG